MDVRNTTTLLAALGAPRGPVRGRRRGGFERRGSRRAKLRYVGGGSRSTGCRSRTRPGRVVHRSSTRARASASAPAARRPGARRRSARARSTACRSAAAAAATAERATFLEVPATLDGGAGNDVLHRRRRERPAGRRRRQRPAARARRAPTGCRATRDGRSLIGGPGPDVVDGGAASTPRTTPTPPGRSRSTWTATPTTARATRATASRPTSSDVIGGPFDDRIAAISGTHRLDGRRRQRRAARAAAASTASTAARATTG